MGDLPDTVNADAFPIPLQPPPFFRDHHVNGRPVLAAVEAMERLVADTRHRFTDIDGRRLKDVRFDKFLFLDTGDPPAVFNRVDRRGDGAIRSTLTSRFTSPGTAITRTLTHVALTLGDTMAEVAAPPLETAACLTGRCFAVDPARIYREMVPFGPAYRNIKDPLLLSVDGALARIGSPDPVDPRTDLHLGSPYVLDAAFHAACVWCQRFRGSVAFPVSMDRRTIVRPTRLDEIYTARVLPVQTDHEPYVFDISIHDDDGELREIAHGVHMRDVSGGRTKPPPGFWEAVSEDPLAPLRRHLSGLVLLERDAVAGFTAAALSENETSRLAPMTPTRARGYLSARLALKRLNRLLSGGGDRRQAYEMETVAEDGRSPQCLLADGTHCPCSVAHDRRFTVAVAAEQAVGVDVEPLSDKPLKAPGLYMDAGEQTLIKSSPLELAEAALRVWSAKEAAAKALNIDLVEAWQRVRIMSLAVGKSRLSMDGEKELTARHALMEGHLFTLLTVEDR